MMSKRLLPLLPGLLPPGPARARDSFLLFAFDASDNGGRGHCTNRDGLAWRTPATGSYKPRIGPGEIFRDPALRRDHPGVFHLLWKSFGEPVGLTRDARAHTLRRSPFVPVTAAQLAGTEAAPNRRASPASDN